MMYSPVLLPTLCRYDSLVKCIDSLKANAWADKTDLIVALDYPKTKTHTEGYRAIKNYLCTEDFSAFNSFQVIHRRRNYGAIDNFLELLRECFSKYDRCICLFDDLEVSSNFIQYMDEMLDECEQDPQVAGVLGYSYPVRWEVDRNCNAFPQDFSGSIWGIGFWKNKYLEMSRYIEDGGLVKDFEEAHNGGRFSKMTDWAVSDYVNSVCYGVAGKSFINQITDISMRIYLAVKDKRFIMPVTTKVRNLGFDGTGAYCEKIVMDENKEINSQNYSYGTQPIDGERAFVPRIDWEANLSVNRGIFNEFDAVPSEKLSAALKRAEWYCSQSRSSRSMLNFKKLCRRISRGIRNRLRL
ncbi:MAG: hypothetical protein IKG85_01605 [Clostridia bacterium]|nr:hypothetical protein [Clostridia bacterium]